MSSVINQAGYAIAVLDFTPETPSLPVGLILLMIFFAAMIVIAAVRYHLARKNEAMAGTMSAEIEYRKAA